LVGIGPEGWRLVEGWRWKFVLESVPFEDLVEKYFMSERSSSGEFENERRFFPPDLTFNFHTSTLNG
jgi:hypothetical protein